MYSKFHVLSFLLSNDTWKFQNKFVKRQKKKKIIDLTYLTLKDN